MKAISALFLAALTALAPTVSAQGDEQITFNSEHNSTVITGTWSTGSKAVKTGPGFSNPANKSFTYPKNSGESYSFSGDGFYEIARYRFVSNATQPNCIKAVVLWVHGKYQLLGNGSIAMFPLGDGYQQIQDNCAAISNFIEDYNHTELMRSWRIFDDLTFGPKLHLFKFDGAPVAPMFQVSETPTMHPTRLLRNVTPPAAPSGTAAKNLLANTNSASLSAAEQSTMLVMALAGLLGFVAIAV